MTQLDFTLLDGRATNRRRPARPKPSIADRLAEFDAANPHVFAELLRLARVRLNRGDRRIGVKALWEDLRLYLYTVHGSTEYRLNNDYTAPYARRLVEIEPNLAGRIELRQRRSA